MGGFRVSNDESTLCAFIGLTALSPVILRIGNVLVPVNEALADLPILIGRQPSATGIFGTHPR
jgi:hypothetical protein